MADLFSNGMDAFTSISDNVQTQRSQIAQFALNKAATYWSANKPDDAIKEFKKVLAFDPQNTDAFTSLGKLYQGKGDLTTAIKYFKTTVQLNRTSVTAHNDLGNAYLQAKQYTDAEKEYKTAAKMDPLNPVADYTLGVLYNQTDRNTEAEAQFLKVAKVSPKDGNVPYSLGVLYNKIGRTDDAVKQLEKALTLKKNFFAANFELGSAYAKQGETDKATAQLSILQSNNSSYAADLQSVLNTPKMVYMDQGNNRNFNQLLGPGTPLWMLDPSQLTTPNSSEKVSVAIQFNTNMDMASVMNPANWEISRAKSPEAGYYNNSMLPSASEVTIDKRPFTVAYDPISFQAKVTFTVTQNSTIDIGNGNKGATIDPAHLVFKFSGKSADGRTIDTGADQIDGAAAKPF